jgi:hypothetical protein
MKRRSRQPPGWFVAIPLMERLLISKQRFARYTSG